MRIIVADDEQLVLKDTVNIIKRVCKEDEICAFDDSLKLLELPIGVMNGE